MLSQEVNSFCHRACIADACNTGKKDFGDAGKEVEENWREANFAAEFQSKHEPVRLCWPFRKRVKCRLPWSTRRPCFRLLLVCSSAWDSKRWRTFPVKWLSFRAWILHVFFSGEPWWSCWGITAQEFSTRVLTINAVPEVLQEFRVVAANTQCKEGLTLNSLLPMPVLANARWNAERKEQLLQQTSHGCVMSHLRSWSCAGWMLTDPNENILAPEEKWPGCEPPKWAWSHVSLNLSISNVVLIKFLPFLPSLLSLVAL